MKIYNYTENSLIKRMKSKKVALLVENNDCIVSVASTSKGEKTLVELPLCKKEFSCDTYTIRDGAIIAKDNEDQHYSLINLETGAVEEIESFEVFDSKTIVTLTNKRRRFLTETGEIGTAEVEKGAFLSKLDEDLNVSFVDTNGFVCENDRTFIDCQNRVRAGYSKDRDGIYSAIDREHKKKVYYNFLGEVIDVNNKTIVNMYREVYEFYKGKIKLADLADSYLLEPKVYNFLVNYISEKYMEKMKQKGKGMVGEAGKRNPFIVKCENALMELKARRDKALVAAIKTDLAKNANDNL